MPDVAAAKDPLLAQILRLLRRHTNRNVYDPKRAVPTYAWQAMTAAVQSHPHPLCFGFVADDEAATIEGHRAIARKAWLIEVSTPRALFESYHWLRIGTHEIAEHHDGISITSPLLVALERLGLFDRTRAPAPDDSAVTSQIRDLDPKIASTQGFL